MAQVRVLKLVELTPLRWSTLGPLMFPFQLKQLPETRRCVCSAQVHCSTSAAATLCPGSPLLASLLSRSLPSRSRDGIRGVHARAAPARLSRGSPKPPLRQKRTPQQPPQRPGRRKRPLEDELQQLRKGGVEQKSLSALKLSAGLKARLKEIRRPAPDIVNTLTTSEDEEQVDNKVTRLKEEDEAGEKSPAPEPSRDGMVEELELPEPSGVRVKSASYVTSSVKVEQCPNTGLPEFAVIGRSNVGKSSLINLLTGRKDLALVSKTPGKTRCINHFLINDSWYLVDLPGYGYAKQSQTNRVEWSNFTQQYFKTRCTMRENGSVIRLSPRKTLVNVLLLVDGSVPTQNVDLGCAEWLAKHEVPFTLVFTKTDKRKKKCPAPTENIRQFEEELSKVIGALPVSLSTSAIAKEGKGDLLTFIAQLRELHQRNLVVEGSGS